MLDQQVVIDVLSDVTSRAVGQEIRVRFLVGPRPGAKKRDRMQISCAWAANSTILQ